MTWQSIPQKTNSQDQNKGLIGIKCDICMLWAEILINTRQTTCHLMVVALFAEMTQSLPCGTFPNGVKPQGDSLCNRWDLVFPVLFFCTCMWKTSVSVKLDCFIWTWQSLLVTHFISDYWYMVLLFIIIFINYSLYKC